MVKCTICCRTVSSAMPGESCRDISCAGHYQTTHDLLCGPVQARKPAHMQPPTGPFPPAFDPSGEGRKVGKVRVELVLAGMPNAIMELGKVMTWALEGKGYKEGDFLHVPDAANKYRGAMYRHDLKELMGQELDDESGLCHAVHTAWNAIARLEILLREKKQ